MNRPNPSVSMDLTVRRVLPVQVSAKLHFVEKKCYAITFPSIPNMVSNLGVCPGGQLGNGSFLAFR